MKARAVLLLALVACSGSPGPPVDPGAPVDFRAIAERVDAGSCVEPPQFFIATSETGWIDVVDRATECKRGGEFELPPVRFGREWGIAAWWQNVPCLGYRVETTSVRIESGSIVVRAITHEPGEGVVCAQATGVLQSLLAIDAEGLTGSEAVRFLLDGADAGTADIGG